MGLLAASFRYTAAVVGAGAFVLPGLAARIAGPGVLAAWALHGLLGLLLGWTLATVAAHRRAAAGASDVVAGVFGARWRAVVDACYFFGIIAGQGAIALAAGYHAAAALGWRPAGALVVAVTVLALGGAGAAAGRMPGERARLALAGALMALLAVLGVTSLLAPQAAPAQAVRWAQAGALPTTLGTAGRAAFLLTFAFVGWEALLGLAPRVGGGLPALRRCAVLTAAAVSALYGGLALAVPATGAQDTRAGALAVLVTATSRLFGSGAAVWVAAFVTVLAVTLCARNVAVAAGKGATSPALVVLLAAGGALAVFLLGWGPEALLAVPGAMGITIYGLVAAAGIRLTRGSARLASAAALALCALLALYGGAALAAPLLALVLTFRWRRRRRHGRAGVVG